MDLTNDVVPLRLFNPTDQPQTVYQDTGCVVRTSGGSF